jgi:hypothetical protein
MAHIPAGPDFFERVKAGLFLHLLTPYRFRRTSSAGVRRVVLREHDVTIQGNSGSGTTPIELVALSLVSSPGIEVDMGNRLRKGAKRRVGRLGLQLRLRKRWHTWRRVICIRLSR